jgi:hypothetical protein
VKIPTSNPFIQRFISENQEYARGILITVIQNTSNKFTLHHLDINNIELWQIKSIVYKILIQDFIIKYIYLNSLLL